MSNYKELKKDITNFFSKKIVQNIIIVILLLSIILVGTYIRVQDIPNLHDPTTGDYTPLDLDSYYFLRHSETLLDNNFQYPEIDTMRYGGLNPPYSFEIMPHAVAVLYKLFQVFDKSVTLNYVNILSPLIFFILGLIVFFFLTLVLTKNKWVSIISTFLLSIIPTYLYRTMAGSSDHDSFGMIGFFLVLLSFYFFFFKLQEGKVKKINSVLFGLVTGFMAIFSISSWGGSGSFIFMIIPITFLINWVVNKKSNNLENILFYASFIFGTLFSTIFFLHTFTGIIRSYMLSTSGIFTFVALLFSLFEFLLLNSKKVGNKIKQNSKLISLGLTLCLGIIFYQLFVGHVYQMILTFLKTIVTPFGTGRVGLTVAENSQPYLTTLISGLGNALFWLFVLGTIIFGFKISEKIEDKKYKILFIGSYIFFIFGLLFTRISASSVLNGDNFFSKAVLFISLLTFLVSSIYIYLKSNWEINSRWISFALLSIVMILSVRSAIRVFFVIIPFVLIIAVFGLFEIAAFAKKSKEELLKILSIILVIFLSIILVINSFGFYKSDLYQSKNTTPPYNADWQNSMSWVRNNTLENDVFLHWWDYGYWIQTGGNRPTVTDGGHFNGYWDHLIGRYVLTTPYPETAKSFMLAHNVSYLLIDPTDIGKYSAYSSIGDDNETPDRSSWMMTFVSDQKEIQETRNSTIRIYNGGTYLDEDLIIEENGNKILLPKGNAGIIGFILTTSEEGVSQPIGVYFYKDKQYQRPIRYLYYGGELLDFGTGVNATMYVYANVYNSGKGLQFDFSGAAMYLTEKTKDSLVAKLYLMDDPESEYSELDLSHVEGSYKFPFYYNGNFYGPIKIWKVNKNEMTNIISREEFLKTEGEYGEFDDLEFIK